MTKAVTLRQVGDSSSHILVSVQPMTMLTDLTDDDITTEWSNIEPVAVDDDATDEGGADDDASDADDDASDADQSDQADS